MKINKLLIAARISERDWLASHTPSVCMENNKQLKQMLGLLYANLARELGVTSAWSEEEWEILLNRSSQTGYLAARLGEIYPVDRLR
jgi:hypothetical protein